MDFALDADVVADINPKTNMVGNGFGLKMMGVETYVVRHDSWYQATDDWYAAIAAGQYVWAE